MPGAGDPGSSYGFDQPVAISSDGSDVWVANQSGSSVTELDAATGGLVQVISGVSYGFHYADEHLRLRYPRLGGQRG